MFHVSVSTPNIGKPMLRTFISSDTAEQYILDIAQGVIQKTGSAILIARLTADQDDVNQVMALLAEVDVDVIYWGPGE